MKVSIEAKPLILKFMVSCANAKIGEPGLDEGTFRRWEDKLAEGALSEKEIAEIEKHSKGLMQKLSSIAERQEKSSIDLEVVLSYFFFDHNDALGHITELSETMRRYINSDVSHDCMAKVGIVRAVDKTHHSASVETSNGKKEVRQYDVRFEKGIAEGDLVIAHRGYGFKVQAYALRKMGCASELPSGIEKTRKKIKGV